MGLRLDANRAYAVHVITAHHVVEHQWRHLIRRWGLVVEDHVTRLVVAFTLPTALGNARSRRRESGTART